MPDVPGVQDPIISHLDCDNNLVGFSISFLFLFPIHPMHSQSTFQKIVKLCHLRTFFSSSSSSFGLRLSERQNLHSLQDQSLICLCYLISCRCPLHNLVLQQPQTALRFSNLFMSLHIYFIPPLPPSTAVTKKGDKEGWGKVAKGFGRGKSLVFQSNRGKLFKMSSPLP